MGTPVKLSGTLVDAARGEAAAADRSLTAQIEHWATIGRAVEKLVPQAALASLKRLGGASVATPAMARREAVGRMLDGLARSEDRNAVQRHLRALGGPRYGTDPKHPGLLVRIGPDGKRTLGRLEGRVFVPVAKERARGSA
jgi:hypothetical protein